MQDLDGSTTEFSQQKVKTPLWLWSIVGKTTVPQGPSACSTSVSIYGVQAASASLVRSTFGAIMRRFPDEHEMIAQLLRRHCIELCLKVAWRTSV